MIFRRMMRAAMLEVSLYEEVEHDPNLTGEAALVVVIATVMASIWHLFFGGLLPLVYGLVTSIVGWIVFAAIAYLIGTKAFGGKADLGEMLRVLGYATTPMCLGIIPWFGYLIGGLWTIATGFIAIRQGLDLDNVKAAVTAVLSVIAYVVVMSLVRMIT